NTGSDVSSDHGLTDARSGADLVILNNQGNTGDPDNIVISSNTVGGGIGAVVDSLEGGAIIVAGNAVTSQGLGNSASSAVQSGENAAAFNASVALASQQINWHANVN